MFANDGLLGANRIWPPIALATLCAAALIGAASDVDALLLYASLPLCFAVALYRPFVFMLVFIVFSYFRLHEVYPVLLQLKIPLISGAASIAGLLAHAILIQSAGAERFRELKSLALLLFALTVSASFATAELDFSMNDRTQALLLSGVLAAAIVCMVVWRFFLGAAIQPGWPKEMTYFVVFFALVTLGVAFARDREVAYLTWSSGFAKIGLMTFAIAWLTRSPADFAAVTRVLVGAGCLVAVVAIYNKLNGIGLVEGTRVTIPFEDQKGATLGDPNDLALVLLFPLGFAVALALKETRSFGGALGLIAIPTLMLAIIFTQSRGGLVGVLATFAVIGLRTVKSKLLLAVLGVLAAAALVVAADLSGRSSGGYDELSQGLDASSSERLTTWTAAVRMMLSAPLTGVGLANYPGQFYYFTDVWLGENKAVHSTWFGVLAEAGLPGFILFMLMFMGAFFSAWRMLSRLEAAGGDMRLQAAALGLAAGLAGFGASGTFLTQGFGWPFYIKLGLAAALYQCVAARLGPSAAAPSTLPLQTRRRSSR